MTKSANAPLPPDTSQFKEISGSIDHSAEGILNRSVELLREGGESLKSFLERAVELQGRRTSGRFHLAVLGQFKRGKSTFINALLRARVLPTAVIPATAIPTYIQYGVSPHVKVLFSNGSEEIFDAASESQSAPETLYGFLERYITEKMNPGNRAGVKMVTVSYPAPMLQNGVVLIDTPGIGSTHTHNTEATLRFLPQCDAAFVVLSPDPPVTDVELSFFKEVTSRAARVFVIINKKDLVSPAELDELAAFVSGVLHTKAGFPRDTAILPVSSRDALSGDNECVRRSGFVQVEEALSRFISFDKSKALDAAIVMKMRTLLSDARLSVDLMIKSLTEPVSRIEKMLEKLETVKEKVDRERTKIFDLISADHRRLREYLEEQAAMLRRESFDFLDRMLRGGDSVSPHHPRSMREVRDLVAEHVPPLFERRLGEMSALFNRKIGEIFGPYNDSLNSIVESVREETAQLFGISYKVGDRSIALEIKREPYWETHKWSSSFSPVPEGFFDAFLPRRLKQRLLRKRIREYLNDIVISNVENLRYSTLLNVDATIRLFRSEIERAVNEALADTSGAIREALRKRGELAEKSGEEVDRLKLLNEALAQLAAS